MKRPVSGHNKRRGGLAIRGKRLFNRVIRHTDWGTYNPAFTSIVHWRARMGSAHLPDNIILAHRGHSETALDAEET